ncbi:hypothetical protein KTO58_19730 [Chitinophaga pendula]|uniref:hypothetical protein n=1 Tax=Chitinophaga TaxID=79328 RepID=UPI000BB07CD8|nr:MULTISPECIES: hypothetical protein [Chitinophaga]ASZ11101.1 hypothetical protein CK934_09070 [Chitinophaga sp. MD30]UCJ05901.1 hypothetical protein KTO58_19730 [Chitinophaga pendula]
MPLDKLALRNTIAKLLTDMLSRSETSIDEFADRLGDAVDVYVKSAEIEYVGGLTAPNGPVTGKFNGKLK